MKKHCFCFQLVFPVLMIFMVWRTIIVRVKPDELLFFRRQHHVDKTNASNSHIGAIGVPETIPLAESGQDVDGTLAEDKKVQDTVQISAWDSEASLEAKSHDDERKRPEVLVPTDTEQFVNGEEHDAEAMTMALGQECQQQGLWAKVCPFSLQIVHSYDTSKICKQ